MKKLLIIATSVVVVLSTGILAFTGENNTTSSIQSPIVKEVTAPVASAVPFTKIMEGPRSSVQKRVNYIITSSDQLNELWKVAHIDGSIPSVDFTKDDVIAVFSGPKSIGGSAIRVARIEDSKKRMVTISIVNQNEQCSTGRQATTTPYQIIILPKTTLPLFHEDEIVTRSCLD